MEKCEKAEIFIFFYNLEEKMTVPKGGVAFFDSGIGGLTVMFECQKRISGLPFYYFSDTQHAPYGNLSVAQIKKLVDAVFEKIATLNPSAVVIACNTVTAVYVEELRKKYPFPIIGTEPAILPAVKSGGETLVLTTPATAKSQRLNNLIKLANNRYAQSKITVCPCETLAGEIEEALNVSLKNSNPTSPCKADNVVLDCAQGIETAFNVSLKNSNPTSLYKGNNVVLDCAQEIETALNVSLKNFKPTLPPCKADNVVLGCTHYIYMKEYVSNFYNAKTFDGNQGIANRLIQVLRKTGKKIGTFDHFEKKPDFQRDFYFLLGDNQKNKLIFEQMFANSLNKRVLAKKN